jgi:hypothetical protein
MNWHWLSLAIVRVASFASISACRRHVQLWVISEVQVVQFLQVESIGLDVIQATKRELRIMRYVLTNFKWAAIRSLLPNKPRGIPRVDDRRVLNGIFWVLRSGTGEAKTSQLACSRAPKDHVTAQPACHGPSLPVIGSVLGKPSEAIRISIPWLGAERQISKSWPGG